MNKHDLLKQIFGHSEFRDGQEALVDALLSGRDALGIMPTGAGKSVCFQLPALILPGTTLIISPLISLMKDQVMALKQMGVPAAYINSSLTPSQTAEAMRRAKNGQYKIIYVAPERLESPDFQDFAATSTIGMITVDEAHCVSQWGQDFRPSYLRIRGFLDGLPHRPVVSAFTATATERVRGDILQLLGLIKPLVITTGFNRPNLFFWNQKPVDKYEALLAFLAERADQSGIIYCSTRKTVEEITDRLIQDEYAAARYHAGLGDMERARNQDAFQYDDVRIMVATNAFGMGIDKSNVSFVVHYNMPQDIESYYQEAGRAGRDGEPADCLLLYGKQDVMTARYLINRSSDNAEIDPAERRELIARGMDRLRQMTFYSTSKRCLRQFLLRYFGDDAPDECGHCSVCMALPFEVGEAKKSPSRTKKNAPPASVSPEDAPLYTALAALRSELARKAGVPSYVVFSNASLSGMAHARPITAEQMLKVAGVGQRKLMQYGELFMAVVRAHTEPNTPPKQRSTKQKATGAPGSPLQQKVLFPAPGNQDEHTLYEHLIAYRNELARAEGVPPFMVLSNATLREMAAKRPQSHDALLEISGIGPAKAQKYAAAFLCALRPYSNLIERSPERDQQRDVGGQIRTEYLGGRGIHEIADFTGLPVTTVREHLVAMGLILPGGGDQ